MRIAALLVVAYCLQGVALADEPRNPHLEVVVGKTVEQNVGYARGWFCDDQTLITAELVTRDDTNYWIVTGVKPGTTVCRVGTDFHRPALVFDVIVAKPLPSSKPQVPRSPKQAR